MIFSFSSKRWTAHRTRVETAFQGVNGDFRGVVRKAALNIKTDWAARWSPSRHLPYIGASVSYDTTHSGPIHTAEIGPDKLRRQGPLGTVIEDANGAARNRATHAGNRAGRREEPRFVRYVGEAADKGVAG